MLYFDNDQERVAPKPVKVQTAPGPGLGPPTLDDLITLAEQLTGLYADDRQDRTGASAARRASAITPRGLNATFTVDKNAGFSMGLTTYENPKRAASRSR